MLSALGGIGTAHWQQRTIVPSSMASIGLGDAVFLATRCLFPRTGRLRRLFAELTRGAQKSRGEGLGRLLRGLADSAP